MTVNVFDELLGAAGAGEMVDLCHRYGRYQTYATETVDSPIGRGLAQRHDALTNYLRTGGYRGAIDETGEVLGARTNYFRNEYAYGTNGLIDGIDRFLHLPAFTDAAAELFDGRPVVEPAIAFANLMLPGQELAVHTDVGEFRGANRKVMPQWLIVAMHHSGLFESWRMPVATGVSWFGWAEAGDFAYWPDGRDGAPARHAVSHDTAVLLDADSVFHGVLRVGADDAPAPQVRPGVVLEAGDPWRLLAPDGEVLAMYPFEQIRFSVSWKAYCFADEAEARTWREGSDDLSEAAVVARLVDDLRSRDLIRAADPPQPDLARLIIDTYIRFPAPLAA